MPAWRLITSRELTIGGVRIADDTDAYCVAEVGHNHQGSLDLCKQLVRIAHECGASAVKLQKRSNRTLYTRAYYDRSYEHENSFGRTYGEHREALEFHWEQYDELRHEAERLGIGFFATAFDQESANFLADMRAPAIKIASGDITNTPLLDYVAQLGIPMIVSTGTAELADVDRAVQVISRYHQQFALLQCTASYPADYADLNLSVIATYRERYPDMVIGLSAHDNGIAMAVAAYVLGARVIEKHFTLCHAMKGTDHGFSLEPSGLKKLVRDLQRVRLALGDGVKRALPVEAGAVEKMGKRLYAARDLVAGQILAVEDITVRSPGGYPQPFKLPKYVGRAIPLDLRAETPMCATGELLAGPDLDRELACWQT